MRPSVFVITALMWALIFTSPLTFTSPLIAQPKAPQPRAASGESARAVEAAPALTQQTLWVFEGPLAPRIQGFAREMYADRVSAHIFDRGALLQHIKAALMVSRAELDQEVLACLSDLRTCDDLSLLMRRLALKERIFVSATEGAEGFEVSLERRGQRRGDVRRFKAQDKDLSEACSSLFEQLLQVGTLSITGLPSSFQLSVDGRPLEVERWPVVLEAGEHELTLTAPEHEPLTLKALVKPSLLTELKVKLLSSKVKFKVIVLDDERMRDLEIKLNGEALKAEEVVEVQINEEYTVTAEAEDRSPYRETHRFSPGEDHYTLTIEMPYSRPYWKVALKRPHEDRVHNSLAYIRVSSGQLNGGSWRADSSDRAPGVPSDFKSQAYGANAWGFDLGVKWDADPLSPTGSLRVDAAGFSYQHISDPITISEGAPGATSCSGSACQGLELTSLDRYLTRLLWVGYQATMWRVTPYANLGLIWLYERGELAGGAGDVSAHSLRLGWEIGVDTLISPEWGVKASMIADTWPGRRSAYQLALGVTYAFSVPYLF